MQSSLRIGASNQFTQYVQLLPSQVQLPTFWTEEERSSLRGTSLEPALEAKMNSLEREFNDLHNATSSIAWCQQCWWDVETGSLSFEDWKLVDAMYRSRALDLPGTGHAMVPCIDVANHASGDDTVALYDTDTEGNAILVLRDDRSLTDGQEVTITYGDQKGACEMLFSYGFLEKSMTSAREIFLDLDVDDDDPLKLAKKAVANSAPGFRLFGHGNSVSWEGPFVWLLCVNEEDGLEFKVMQKNDGDRELKVLWRDTEMSDLSGIEALLRKDLKWPLFQLRATVTIRDRIQKQIILVEENRVSVAPINGTMKQDHTPFQFAARLQELEAKLMLQAYEEFENKVAEAVTARILLRLLIELKITNELFPSEAVQQFLSSTVEDESTQSQEDDFA